MTFMRWCDHCQKRTAHQTSDTGCMVWVNGKPHYLPEGYEEISCSRCHATTMDYVE